MSLFFFFFLMRLFAFSLLIDSCLLTAFGLHKVPSVVPQPRPIVCSSWSLPDPPRRPRSRGHTGQTGRAPTGRFTHNLPVTPRMPPLAVQSEPGAQAPAGGTPSPARLFGRICFLILRITFLPTNVSSIAGSTFSLFLRLFLIF